MYKIAILPQNEAYEAEAGELAARLALPIITLQNPKGITDFFACLIIAENGLSLQQCGAGALGPVHVDFVGGKIGHRIKYGGGKGQMLAKAVGLKNKKGLQILDATAGLGQDGFILASLGCRVTMLERSGIVAALLKNGLERALECADTADIARRISFVEADAAEYMASLQEGPDVIYLDPMFPQREKSALVKKEMRIFKEIVGADEDAGKLLEAAIAKAKYRVVVKRPRKSPYLGGKKPSFQLEGKANRFDVYAINSMGKE